MHLSKIHQKEYQSWLKEIKSKIQSSQIKASISVNTELLALYWALGRMIVDRQENSEWGASIIPKLGVDLKREFPGMLGFSRRNLFNIRKWFLFYRQTNPKVQQLVAQIPWGHNVLIITKVDSIEEARFYLNKTLENNWSRNVLGLKIESDLFRRQGALIDNFDKVLPKAQSDLAREMMKDPYMFDFLTLTSSAKEKDLQKHLLQNITQFLLELGAGFAFVGSEYELSIGKTNRRIDLLFYHLKLRAYIAIELKMTEFRPEYAGKMNFYLNAIDDFVRGEYDQVSIGIILCKSKDEIVVEYALRGLDKPLGVSEFRLIKQLPEELKNALPTTEQLEEELSRFPDELLE